MVDNLCIYTVERSAVLVEIGRISDVIDVQEDPCHPDGTMTNVTHEILRSVLVLDQLLGDEIPFL